jgi:TetR/AcrR family transcriptional regulator, transcriptional repressor for nem operon
MARTLKEDEYKAKRNTILDAAMSLVLTKGYDHMTIQDILDGLRISRGALYHYFDSKLALLDAYIDRINLETDRLLLPIVENPDLTGRQKLQEFFLMFDTFRQSHRDDVIRLSRVWYGDGNALVREKVNQAVLAQRSSLLARIIRQGASEGSFNAVSPDLTGEAVYALFMAMGAAHSRLLLSTDENCDTERLTADLMAVYETYMTSIERLLALPDGSLRRADASETRIWVEAPPDSD